MFGHLPVRKMFYLASAATILGIEFLATTRAPWLRWTYTVVVPLIGIGIGDVMQTRHAIKRNFPLLGHGRYLMEFIRPEINQYFVESDIDGRPFDREKRSNVYQRAKKALNTHPFGTKRDVYNTGYEWINHSITPKPLPAEPFRVQIGGPLCSKPYEASVFNISAMSFGALSKNAVMALNLGAKAGHFYHNTGEGGLSPYHLQGGDVVWQLGTGYFSARTPDGRFCETAFAKNAAHPSVKMIELKLSQGAKPGHGGILPKEKITPEIAAIRLVEMGQDVLSPSAHTAFDTPVGLLTFLHRMRELSGGKPVGFKLCMGNRYEFLAICKAMLETKLYPDFITIDGGEGGTGAAPLEFSDSVGTPLEDGLAFAHNALIGFNLRDKIRLIASGKVTTGFSIVRQLALGADLCNSARGMMFALGCIQALQCHANTCPTGVATQNPDLTKGLSVEHKWQRVRNFHQATVHNFMEILAAAGLSHPNELRRWHIHRRVRPGQVKTLAKIYPYIDPGSLLLEPYPGGFGVNMPLAQAHSFLPAASPSQV